MAELFWFALIGHLVGNYLFQNSWMFYYKKLKPLPCFAHCVIYTMTVSLALVICPSVDTVPLGFALWLFTSHWIIERYKTIDFWFILLKIPSWDSINARLENKALIHQTVTISFGTVMYTIANNTVQLLVLTYLLYKFY